MLKTRVFLGVLAGLLAMAVCASASTSPITLTDYFGTNSVVRIDPYTQAGVYDWLVDGSDQITQNSYWFRIGDSGPASPISSIGSVSVNHTIDSAATVIYSGSTFDLQITYTLIGADPGSGTSDLAQTVLLKNKTGSKLDLHLFEYANLDLSGTASGDSAAHTSATHITQQDGKTTSELGVQVLPNHWEIASDGGIINRMTSATFRNLSDSSSPASGNVDFAYQWDLSLARYSSLSISQDDLLAGAAVPEPGSIVVLAGGIGLLPLLRRRRH